MGNNGSSVSGVEGYGTAYATPGGLEFREDDGYDVMIATSPAATPRGSVALQRQPDFSSGYGTPNGLRGSSGEGTPNSGYGLMAAVLDTPNSSGSVGSSPLQGNLDSADENEYSTVPEHSTGQRTPLQGDPNNAKNGPYTKAPTGDSDTGSSSEDDDADNVPKKPPEGSQLASPPPATAAPLVTAAGVDYQNTDPILKAVEAERARSRREQIVKTLDSTPLLKRMASCECVAALACTAAGVAALWPYGEFAVNENKLTGDELTAIGFITAGVAIPICLIATVVRLLKAANENSFKILPNLLLNLTAAASGLVGLIGLFQAINSMTFPANDGGEATMVFGVYIAGLCLLCCLCSCLMSVCVRIVICCSTITEEEELIDLPT